jgi:hypothetical protein
LLLLLVVDPSINPYGGDSAYYAAGNFDGFRPPLYILFLKATLPAGIWLPLALQCALTIGTGLATYWLRGNFIAGLLIAACPFFALFDFRLLAESLYIDLLWLGWLLLSRDQGIGAGVLVGLAILTRDTLLLLPLFALPFLRSRPALVMVATAYLIALPWFLSVNSGARMGLNLWAGTWERNGEWYLAGLDRPDFPSYAFASPQEKKAVTANWIDDAALQKAAFKRIRERPFSTAKAWIVRYPNLWLSTRADFLTFRAARFSSLWYVEKSFFYALNLGFLLFGLWGLLKPDWMYVPPIAYAALVYVPFHAEPRYTLFAYPFLIWMGVQARSRSARGRRCREDRPSEP